MAMALTMALALGIEWLTSNSINAWPFLEFLKKIEYVVK